MMNDSEVIFTFWQNTSLSDHDNQTECEFPQWRPVVSLLLLGFWIQLVSLTFPLTISVIIATMKSSFNRKLGSIHNYVLVVNIFIRACTTLVLSSQIPPAIRFCDCSTTTNFIFFYLILFNMCYQPYMLASLAVFQFIIIKGKKKFVNYKTVGVTLLKITALTIVLPTIFLGLAIIINRTGTGALCHNTIGCAGVDTPQLGPFIASFVLIVWVPSVSILLTATAWSCAIFKRDYAGDDNGLTRRIVAMPLVMPVIASLISIVAFASYRVGDFITPHIFVSNSFIRNWNASLRLVVVLLNETTNGISYPCFILFLNPKLWESWKKILKLNKFVLPWKKNRVTPEQSNTFPTQQ